METIDFRKLVYKKITRSQHGCEHLLRRSFQLKNFTTNQNIIIVLSMKISNKFYMAI